MMNETQRFAAAPPDMGADVFISTLMPVIREAGRTMDATSRAQLYAGVMFALYGSLCIDFGAAGGADLFRIFSDKLMRSEPWERFAMTAGMPNTQECAHAERTKKKASAMGGL